MNNFLLIHHTLTHIEWYLSNTSRFIFTIKTVRFDSSSSNRCLTVSKVCSFSLMFSRAVTRGSLLSEGVSKVVKNDEMDEHHHLFFHAKPFECLVRHRLFRKSRFQSCPTNPISIFRKFAHPALPLAATFVSSTSETSAASKNSFTLNLNSIQLVNSSTFFYWKANNFRELTGQKHSKSPNGLEQIIMVHTQVRF